jgi:glycosyltransferase involved in cell wall biosynthesis
MNVLFIHQNMPGQFGRLAAAMAADPANRVVFLTRRNDRQIANVRRVVYQLRRTAHPSTHPYLQSSENAVLYGQAVARALLALGREGFSPDVIIGHPGWGETLFVKDIFPRAAYLNYCEYYYGAEGGDFAYDPAFPPSPDARPIMRMRNTTMLQTLLACDQGISPTFWQKSVHPPVFHDKIAVIHDGIDVGGLRPDEDAVFTLPEGRILSRKDQVVTYVARNLEPYRGFPTFMRAVPLILDAAPQAEILIIGGDDVSYGGKPKDAANWREAMVKEIGLNSPRVHFTGPLPYNRYKAALQISSAHVYLTYPFVLSWSMMEAMAMGCLVIGSATAPVLEVIKGGVNGLLVDFFSPGDVADKVETALRAPQDFAPLRARARETVIERYALTDSLTRQIALIHKMIK